MSITREAARARLCSTVMERFRLAARLCAANVGWVPAVDNALADKGLMPARERSISIEITHGTEIVGSWIIWPREFWKGVEAGDAGPLELIRVAVEAIADHAVTVAEAVVEPRRCNAILHRASLAWRFPIAPWALFTRGAESPMLQVSLVTELERETVLIPAAVAREIPAAAGFGRAEIIPAREATGEPAADGVRFTMWGASRAMPEGITMETVIAALRNASTQEARDAAQVIADADANMTDHGRSRHVLHEAAIMRALDARGLVAWHPWAVAAVLYALRESDDAHGRGSYPVSANASSFAATVQLSNAHRATAIDATARRTFFQVRWDGRVRPVQLSLGYEDDLDGAMLHSLLKETSEWGLRDWFGYHVLADRYGRTGEFPVEWETFKRIVGYDKAIERGDKFNDLEGKRVRMTDETARRAWVRRLWRFARAELWADVGGVRAEKPVGGMPFLGIAAIGDRALLDPWGKGRDIEFTRALVRLNPELYKGARLDSPEPYYTGLPLGGFALRGPAFQLHAFIAMRLRIARDTRGIKVRFTEASLMRYAGIVDDPKHRGRARSQLVAELDKVVRVMGDGASYATEDTAKGRAYDIDDAQWRRELHAGAGPDRPARLAFDTPQVCGDLQPWRAARGLSQARAAAALGVPIDALKRAELRGKAGKAGARAALPPSLRDAPWRNGGPARKLDAAPSVEVDGRRLPTPSR